MEVKTCRRNVLGELKTNTINQNLKSARESVPTYWRNTSSVGEEITKQAVFRFEHPKPSSHLTNLELLTKVASGISFDNDKDTIPEFGDENINLNDNCSREHETYNKPRKEKSLSILCDKFLKLYPLKLKPGNYIEISLDQATQFIGTDRRRIYDILIVLECLQMASKVCKNHYQWHGTQHLEGTLAQLKWLALKLGFFQNVDVEDDNVSFSEDCAKDSEALDLNVLDPLQMNIQTQKVLSNSDDISQSSLLIGKIQDQKPEDDSDLEYKDSSLGIMCQKFLMLFLVKSKVITLDNAAKILLGASGEIKDCYKVKTKIRRLYDIANVLSSLELIKKVNTPTACDLPSGSLIRLNKKPAFQYIGPDVAPKPLPDHALVTLNTTRHSLLGHPLHAAWEKKYSRKRKSKAACPILPKQQMLNDGSSARLQSKEPFFVRTPSFNTSSAGSGSPREKFPRSHSENCIGGSPMRHGSLRSDILQVAELELQRICSEEEQKKKEREASASSTHVAPKSNLRHYHSENCISVGSVASNVGASSHLKSSKDTNWENSILKNNNIRVNANLNVSNLMRNAATFSLSSQRNNNSRKDVSICIINHSNGKTAKGQIVSLRESVPMVIRSVQKNSRVRGISINPVPISVSNCIMGPAYIIRQQTSGTATNINPVSISLSKVEHVSSKDILCIEGNSAADVSQKTC